MSKLLELGIDERLDQAIRMLLREEAFSVVLNHWRQNVLPAMYRMACGPGSEKRDWHAGCAFILQQLLDESDKATQQLRR